MKLKFKDKQEYKNYFLPLIEKERKAEKEFYINEIKKLSGKEREKKGRAILNCKAKFLGDYIGGFYLYKFSREEMPRHQINAGDLVLVSVKNPLKDGIEATVLEKGNKYLTLVFSQKINTKSRYRIDLYVNDITFKRMEEALEDFVNSKNIFDEGIILGNKEPEYRKENLNIDFKNKNLNKFQKEAVKKSLLAKEIFLIHGPPGTGKTTTLIESIIQHIKQGKKILATADSNTAVDNLVEGLLKYNVNLVRIGHPARVREDILSQSLDIKLTKHKKYQKIRELENKIQKLKKQQDNFQKPVPAKRRGLTDEEILLYAKLEKKVRGHKIQTIKSMANWIQLQQQISALIEEKLKVEEEIINNIINTSDIVLATNSGSYSHFLKEKKFDVVFIDEAGQATEPSTLMPLIKAKKAILAGDHKQLPPTILSEEAKELSFTMFERFTNLYPQFVYMLKIQYRMNEIIMKFPSRQFYNNELIADESVRNITLSQIIKTLQNSPIIDDTPIIFIDTQGHFPEKQKKDSQSKYNPDEAKLIKNIVEELLEAGLSPKDIGIITPYKDQEDFLKKLVKDVEIQTVDGFQGREKEVIIISLVRSNEEGDIGFLEDLRRLNVAITRPKRKLIIIGDKKTIENNPTYRMLISYIKQKGKFLKESEI
ncbi:MAG: IGHMBP2 family helicase [Hydrogenothermus sp.]|nr:MAG: IGHMBP2 family helicase [Hydrogenothermus sp.]